ncbi:zinc ribbon domain-containing protein [Streptomyces sp. WAC 00631]|uniref:NADase-type glycan-binding domain-containing protein n=1 Tax=unclassified Streptomyces TaxID=2593676 RepID=UPI000F78C12B|nr:MULTISPECIES: zinc ribbon domain-containing protein [unclassified Streptomyces]MCC5033438.1 zinc ribbon domain-containing protein [Streptomyces sp. WAC 00631]MCC9741527.1 zinc ribbon domain-containing protein [Streptomyces sp. MNU89]
MPAPRGTTERPPREDDAAARARALVVPVAEPGPRAPAAPDPVAPVLPGRPNAARPQVRRPAGEVEESGAVCPWCSTGNRPDRHFCRRCAMSLAGEPDGPAGRRPWWRRLFAGRNEVRWAGERPRLRRGLAWLLPLIGWGLVAALVITAVFMAPAAIQAVKDHFAKRAPVSPDTYAASRSYADNGPELAFDKFSNTFWGPGITGDGAGEWIEARFAQPVDTLDVLVTPGVSARSNELAKSARPSRLEALITTADGKKETRTLTLDQGTRQQRPLRARDVISVRFTVVSSFGAGADKQVAIAEIEFFGPSGSYSRR